MRTVNQFFASTIGGNSLLFENASVVLSPFLIRPEYTGACWRVRRVSDAVLLDVGFDGGGMVSEAELVAFLGTGQGRLHTYYNQVGANHAIAPATTQEPLVWDNGFVTGLEGLPAVDFEGTANRRMIFESMVESITTNGSLCLAVIDRIDTASLQQIFSNRTENTQFRSSSAHELAFAGVASPGASLNAISAKKIVGFEINTVNEEAVIFDEYIEGPISYFSLLNTPSWRFNQLGARNVTGEVYRGRIHELFFFEDRLLTNRRNIIKNRKSIYHPGL
ncbi:hypothetical protein SAMN05192553_102660 [Cyclobacterium xiamenense]|uniref:Uncharacterized protein n=1 Tax=Cyclobacterium xiamenense TaxID=1297121 RepID=A0A1H6WEP4_9BACT|nr:hypothetical protein [Cyclobacterium xiamenense]SEJ15501.1 hypothetical protein SAMN05192553_102660 [Cyclobacterium xiamenense]